MESTYFRRWCTIMHSKTIGSRHLNIAPFSRGTREWAVNRAHSYYYQLFFSFWTKRRMGLKRLSISSLPPHVGQLRTPLLEQIMGGIEPFLFWAYLLFCTYFVVSWQSMSIQAWQRNSQFRFSRYLPCLFEGFEGLWRCHSFLATGYSMWGVNEWMSVVRINFWWHTLIHSKTQTKTNFGYGKKKWNLFSEEEVKKEERGWGRRSVCGNINFNWCSAVHCSATGSFEYGGRG